MTKQEKIEDEAYMIISGLAFLYDKANVVVINMNKISQHAKFKIENNDIIMYESNMSKANTYKSM